MPRPYNQYSKHEDKTLFEAMENLKNYAMVNYKLPKGFIFEHWKYLSFDLMKLLLIHYNVSSDFLNYLDYFNPGGSIGRLQPDGGCIVAVKKDIGGNIIDWLPILMSEAKHQDSLVGNASERAFKNYNGIKRLFLPFEIFPYICFIQGNAVNSQYQMNKLRIGMGNDINREPLNIYDITLTGGKTEKQGSFYASEKWQYDEIYKKLKLALEQSYDYFRKEIMRC